MKKILRVLFICVILVFSVFMFFGMYNNQVSNNLTKLLTEAIDTYDETSDMSSLVQIFGIWQNPTDKTPAATAATKDGHTNLAIYPTENQYSVTYKPEGEKNETEISRLEDVYLFSIVHPTFQKIDNDDKTNKSGLVLKSANYEYTYLFYQTDTINKDIWMETPTTELEANFFETRTITTTYTSQDYDIMLFTISETTMGFIMSEYLHNESVTSINMVDSVGKDVYEEDVLVKLDYSQQFFTDLAEFKSMVSIYNEYVNTKDEAIKTQAEAAAEYINKYLDNPNDVIDNFDTYYMQGIKQEQIYTGAPMIFTSLGYSFLFLTVGALFYIFFFHFELIRNLGLWISQAGRAPKPNDMARKNPPKKNEMKGAPKAVKKEEPKVIDVEPIDVKEEPKEEAIPEATTEDEAKTE